MKLMDATLQVGAPIGNVAEWCRLNRVDRRTYYRHRTRVAAEGAWTERSRRPRRSPTATPQWLVARIVTARERLAPDNGADNIRAALAEQAELPDWPGEAAVPARATINRVLGRHDLLDRNPRKRPRSSYRRFAYARPRDCFQIDGTEHTLADGRVVVAIDIIDDCSRVWVASHVAPRETAAAAIAALTGAVSEFGAPGLVLADNGAAFSGGARKNLTRPGRFAAAVLASGARLIHSSPYHPQTLGKCERLHQTADKLLAHFYDTPASSLPELQTRLDAVREHYNTGRRHSAVATTPQRAWDTAPAHGGPEQLPLQTDATVHRLTVVAHGTIALGHHALIRVGTAHAGTQVTALINGTQVTVYTANGDPLGQLTLDPTKRYQGKLNAA